MPLLSDLPESFVLVLGVLLGLVFGSFLNVVIYRLPLGLSVVRPASSCPACGAKVRAIDNVPVVSWLVLRGRARCCGVGISARYPVVELIGGLTGWAVTRHHVLGLDPETVWWRALVVLLLSLAFCLGLIAAAFIDLEHMLLPDEITLGGTALGLLSVPLRPGAGFIDSVLGAAIGFFIVWFPFCFVYRLLRGQPGMGLGDAKLLMLAGAWLGWQGAIFVLVAGSFQGTLIALAVYLVRGRIDEPEAVLKERAERQALLESASGEERAALEQELARDPVLLEPEPGLRRARVPFGPALVLAAFEFFFFGGPLLEWYFDVLAL